MPRLGLHFGVHTTVVITYIRGSSAEGLGGIYGRRVSQLICEWLVPNVYVILTVCAARLRGVHRRHEVICYATPAIYQIVRF